MERFRWFVKNNFIKLGWQGILSTLLLVLCIFAYGYYFLPAQKREAALNQQILNIRNHPDRFKQLKPENVFKDFWTAFPSQSDLGMTVRKVQQIASEKNVDLSRVDYKYSKLEGIPLIQYQMAFSMNASYMDMRRFISSVLVSFPNSALHHIEMNRESAIDEEVESKIALIFYFREAQ